MIYKERYEIQKVKSPEDVKKSFYVRHLIPKDGGTYLAIGEIRYFETLEAAKTRTGTHAIQNMTLKQYAD